MTKSKSAGKVELKNVHVMAKRFSLNLSLFCPKNDHSRESISSGTRVMGIASSLVAEIQVIGYVVFISLGG